MPACFQLRDCLLVGEIVGQSKHGELRGKNILIRGVASAVGRARREALGATPKAFTVDKKGAESVQKSLAESRQKLFSIRSKRPRPHLDDKIIAAWNGLMISAFARGGQILGDTSYLKTATRAAEFVATQLYDESRKILFRSYREGRSEIEGFADDYAFFVHESFFFSALSFIRLTPLAPTASNA